MKICYIVGHYPPHIGGVEILFQDYAQGMAAAGNEVRVVTSASGGIYGRHERNGTEVYYYNWKVLFGHPLPRKKDMEEHVKWADIVHTTTFTVANPARKLCKKYKKPSLITIHEVLGDKWYWIEPNRMKAFGFRMFEKYVCCKPYDYIHVISDATLNDYKKYYGNKENMVRIYIAVDHDILNLPEQSTVDFNKHFEVPEGKRRFLYFGRPGQSKGIFVYIKAILLLKQKYGTKLLEQCRFCFVISDDPLTQKKKFMQIVQQNHLEKYVLVKPSMKRKDLFKIISQADYIVVPSITEGFGFTAAESCLLGKKLVFSDGGSLPEVASGHVLSFRNRDSEDLSEKLFQIIQRDEEAFTKIPFKDFRKEEMIEKFISFYKTIMNQYGKC